ncbi:histidinol-phosphate transaminase [Paenibacillus sp. N1-5-1-14]|uniref:histidinol-phosphate transaminase n=1 Tax=Paenibacillus radicibacter TaxID=2972488 RepID=UPI002159154E|nr:histidinol-phosphate transaminase [Paenibacillus radicibacter]MCR8641241.1 histidinol-phosphate transaminase [Paenibacillus radicibacter]
MQTSDRIPTRKEIENIGVYTPGKPLEEVRRELGITHVIKLASNENPNGCSPLVKEAIIQELSNAALYPESTAPELTSKLALMLGVQQDQIITGNGSDEIIRLLTRSYVRTGDEVIMANVTFPRYETNVQIEGGIVVTVPLVEGAHDLEEMLRAINHRTRMIFVCNPNNPTGTIVGEEELLTFIQKVPPHVILVIDEAYYEYVQDSDYLQTLPLLASYPNLVVLRTFSKIYGLASLRMGYGIMHPTIVQSLIKVKEPFNTNRLAQVAAIASLDDEAFVTSCVQDNAEGRNYLEQELVRMGLTYFQSHANFLMIHMNRSGQDVFQGLLAEGVIVRSGTLLGYPETIRVTIGTPEENKAFIQALEKVLTTA